jgi:hypothetical protein
MAFSLSSKCTYEDERGEPAGQPQFRHTHNFALSRLTVTHQHSTNQKIRIELCRELSWVAFDGFSDVSITQRTEAQTFDLTTSSSLSCN